MAFAKNSALNSFLCAAKNLIEYNALNAAQYLIENNIYKNEYIYCKST